jgi:hypothetical protein
MKNYRDDFKQIQIQTTKLISADFLGNFKSAFKGNGLVFSEFKTREEGEDTNSIDWLVSRREGRYLMRKMEEERQISLLFLFDFDETMNFDFGKSKIDMLWKIFFMIAFSAIKDGDKIGSVFFWKDNFVFTPFSATKSWIFNIYKSGNTYNSLSSKKKKTLDSVIDFLQNLKMKRKLIFIITDKLEVDEKKLRGLSYQNDIIFINIFHHIENTLDFDDDTIINLGEKGKWNLFIDTYDNEKKEQYKALRKKKIENFEKKVKKNGGDYIFIDETKDIFKEFFIFMKRRGI